MAGAAMASASYAELVTRTLALLTDHKDLKGIIRAASAGDMLAVLDRNDLVAWLEGERVAPGAMPNARLLRIEDTNEEVQWRLLTENGEVIDEPDDGCPATGFTTTDLLLPPPSTHPLSV